MSRSRSSSLFGPLPSYGDPTRCFSDGDSFRDVVFAVPASRTFPGLIHLEKEMSDEAWGAGFVRCLGVGLAGEKGRLVDFLMEDITSYQDSEVGAAARVIHQGCKQVLQEYFQIAAISDAAEGTQVTVPASYSADEYRLVGRLSGEPPFTGTLLHKGWKTEFVKLPRIVNTERLPSIAPAEVELK